MILRMLISFCLFFSQIAYADEIKIELNPPRPVIGEVFQAVFHIYTNSNEQPMINFNPFRLEVVGKSNYGVKTSTLWVNGKFSTTREVTIVYELAANDVGVAGLRDINVKLGTATLRHPSLTFNVLKEPEVTPDVFVMADVPKKELFVGEGIVVRYFLYSKVGVSNLDIKKYPKLNNFLKRFLQEPERTERVTVDGQLYMRTQIYGVKLFPEKVGELKIDPLQLSAAVIVSRPGDPFSSFGMSRESRQKSLSSEIVKITVRPLPEEGRPDNFTGLVGKHEFELQKNSTRLIVNEPLEFKLSVTGGGALENMEAPTLIKHPDLEEFESNGDLKIQNAEMATKVFEYTLLPKANLNIPASTISLSYFDPNSMKYIPVQLPVTEIVVAGGSASENKKTQKVDKKEDRKKNDNKIIAPDLAGPIVDGLPWWKIGLSYLNIILILSTLIIGLVLSLKLRPVSLFNKSSIPRALSREPFSLSEFTRWLEPLILRTGKSPSLLIKDSTLSPEAKRYFLELLEAHGAREYSHLKDNFKYVYNSKMFKELDHYMRSENNENSI
jgi:hypothetical protein